MSPYKPDVIKDLIAEAIQAAPRGTQTRLAEATGVGVQTVNKWAKKQTAPEMHRWTAIEEFFGWPPGHMVKASGLKLGRSILQIGNVELEAPPDFVVDVGQGVMLVVIDSGDPITERLLDAVKAERPDDRRAQSSSKNASRRLREMLETGDVARITVPGSDAEVYAIRSMPPTELPAAAEKGKATGARKAARRRPKPPAS